jgi:hypothetical protein
MSQKRVILFSIVLVSGLLLNACELLQRETYCSDYAARELRLNDTIELRYGELYCNSRHDILLSVDSIQDSRCPIGAYCIWEGNGRVYINLSHGGMHSSFWLNTHVNFLQDSLVDGLNYELTDLLPYPEVGMDYELEDVRVLLLITD